MSRLAVVLALSLIAAPTLAAPAPSPPPEPLAAPAPCGPDIDPGFVKYVAPPTDHGGPNLLLWLIGGPAQTAKSRPAPYPRYLDFRPAIQARIPARLAVACPGVEPVAGGR